MRKRRIRKMRTMSRRLRRDVERKGCKGRKMNCEHLFKI
jgi:hypothetical protein